MFVLAAVANCTKKIKSIFGCLQLATTREGRFAIIQSGCSKGCQGSEMKSKHEGYFAYVYISTCLTIHFIQSGGRRHHPRIYFNTAGVFLLPRCFYTCIYKYSVGKKETVIISTLCSKGKTRCVARSGNFHTTEYYECMSFAAFVLKSG